MEKQTSAINSGISLFECAALSLDVYREDGRPLLPPGWIPEASTELLSGFVVECYAKYITSLTIPDYIVFAYRGTAIRSKEGIGDIIADIQTANENAPIAISKFIATPFIWDNLKRLGMWDENGNCNQNTQIIQTGHSLGAIFADAMNSIANINGKGKSITFENPGSKNVLIDFWEELNTPLEQIQTLLKFSQSTCEAYLADINAINSCNEQVGQCYRLTNLPYNYGANNKMMAWISPSVYANANYWLWYTLDQHSIQNIYDYFKDNGSIGAVSYPFGFQNGYIGYLDSSRINYWSGYADAIWQDYPEIHELYHNNFEEYFEEFMIDLKKIQQEAKSQLTYELQGYQKAALINQFGMFHTSNTNSNEVNKTLTEDDENFDVEYQVPSKYCFIL